MCIESGQNVRVKFFVEMDFQKEFNLLGPQVEFSLCFAAPYVDAMQKTAESFQAHGGLWFFLFTLFPLPHMSGGRRLGLNFSSSLGSSCKIHFLPEVELRSISQCRQQPDEPSFLSSQWKICFSKLSISTQKASDLWKGHFLTENPSAREFPNQLFFWNLLPHRLKITQTWWLSSHVTKANVLLESLVTAEVCCFC